MAKKTALYDKHIALGGKMVEFAGYALPLQYVGIIEEHRAVRNAAGLFDVSHMGEFLFKGKDAERALNFLLTNDIRGMRDGQGRYSIMPNESGGAVDDVIVGRESAEKFWVVVNAANREKDAAWVRAHLPEGDVAFFDLSDDIAQLALQGPQSETVLRRVMKEKDIPAKYYTFARDVQLGGHTVTVARTGYTGEDGFEVYCLNAIAGKVYDIIERAAREAGVEMLPCGLGAARYPATGSGYAALRTRTRRGHSRRRNGAGIRRQTRQGRFRGQGGDCRAHSRILSRGRSGQGSRYREGTLRHLLRQRTGGAVHIGDFLAHARVRHSNAESAPRFRRP